MKEGYSLLLLLILIIITLGVTFSVYAFRGRRAILSLFEEKNGRLAQLDRALVSGIDWGQVISQ
jgi:hypothetical protein